MTIDKIGAALSSPIIMEKRETAPVPAGHFDAVFMQTMQKSNSIEQHFIRETSPFTSNSREKVACSMPITQEEVSAPTPSVDSPAPLSFIPPLLNKFAASLWPYAAEASKLIGLDPKLLIAQAALETGWGRFIAKDAQGNSSNNLFNIKASKRDAGESLEVKTTEYIDNKPVKLTAAFKIYPSPGHSFQDYLNLIQGSPRYREAVESAHDPEAYARALQKAGYATDPEYANKMLAIYHGAEIQA